MTIRVDCDLCGESLSLKDNAAGRKIKCRCGSIVQVPQDEEDLDEVDDADVDIPSRRGRKSRRRTAASNRQVTYALYAGGGLAGLVVLYFLFQMFFGVAEWKPDPQLLGELDQEQSGAGYAIRLPKGWRRDSTKNSTHNGPQGPMAIQEVEWTGPTGKIHLEIWQGASLRGKRRPTIKTENANVLVDDGLEPMYVLPGAKISTGTLGGRLFTRAEFKFDGLSIGPVAHDLPNHIVYVTYVDDQRVDIIASSRADLNSQEFRVLEESLKSIRKLNPGESLNNPSIAPPAPTLGQAGPAFAANNSRRTPLNGGASNTKFPNENPQQTAATQPADPNGNNVPPQKKSGLGFKPKESKADWGSGAETKVITTTKGEKSDVIFSELNPALALVDDTLFDVTKGESLGAFPVSGRPNNTHRALSVDGKLIATAASNSTESPEIVTIHVLGEKGFGQTISTGSRVKQSSAVKFLLFNAPNRLTAGVESSGGNRPNKIYIFNTETRKIAKEISCGDVGEIAALSQDGKYLCNYSRTGISVYDLVKGVKVATMENPSGTDGSISLNRCSGLAFSPDGTELAALLDRNRVVAWSARGKIVFDEILPTEVGQVFDERPDGLQWLPDAKSWLLGSQYLLLRDQKLLVWNLQRKWPYDRQPVRVADQDHVVALVSNQHGGDLVRQEIPWADINRMTGDANLDEISLVKPGEAMSIEVQVLSVRFGNAQEVANILGTALTKRIERSKFKVVQGKNVILKATYNEEQGAEKRVTQGVGFGRDTGQRVNDSKGKLEIKIVSKETGESAWEQVIHSDGGLFIEGEISDASVRNRMFRFIEARVNQLALPTIIPKPGTLKLPLVTNLER